MKPGTRSYGQRCGLAASLDLLGERWTLLVLRELARGPKRFGDLLEGLPGIGTNLLSARLKTLESADVIKRVTLPPPAAVAAYDLDERGRSLRPILEDLALWGFGLLADAGGEQAEPRAAWAAMLMDAQMKRSGDTPPDGTYAFDVGEESFWLRIKGGESALRDGAPPFEPDVHTTVGRQGFFDMASGNATPAETGAGVEGDPGRLETLLETFRLPEIGPEDGSASA